MSVNCYPILNPPGVGLGHGLRHTVTHHPHLAHGIGHGGHHAAVHPVGAAPLPVFGPPAPPAAFHCARIPGELPAGPGAGPFAGPGAGASAGGAPVGGAPFAPGGGVVPAGSGVVPAGSGVSPGGGGFGQAFYNQGFGAVPAVAPAAVPLVASIGSLMQAGLLAGGLGMATMLGGATDSGVSPIQTAPTMPIVVSDSTPVGPVAPILTDMSPVPPSIDMRQPSDTPVVTPVTPPVTPPTDTTKPPATVPPDTPPPVIPINDTPPPATAVPEPDSLVAMASAIVALALARTLRRRRSRA